MTQGNETIGINSPVTYKCISLQLAGYRGRVVGQPSGRPKHVHVQWQGFRSVSVEHIDNLKRMV